MESKLKRIMKEMRKGESQQKLALELNVSRESVSAYENGRARIPADIASAMMERKENPRFAFALRNEYTQTGPVWLDGPNVDLHQSSVREKTMEEMNEAIIAISGFSFARSLKNLPEWERPAAEELLEEVAEAITAMELFLARTCEETGISYTGVWSRHYKQLKAKGWLI